MAALTRRPTARWLVPLGVVCAIALIAAMTAIIRAAVRRRSAAGAERHDAGRRSRQHECRRRLRHRDGAGRPWSARAPGRRRRRQRRLDETAQRIAHAARLVGRSGDEPRRAARLARRIRHRSQRARRLDLVQRRQHRNPSAPAIDRRRDARLAGAGAPARAPVQPRPAAVEAPADDATTGSGRDPGRAERHHVGPERGRRHGRRPVGVRAGDRTARHGLAGRRASGSTSTRTEHVPLRLRVFAKGYASPAFEIGFTQVSFERPDASIFDFSPPAGATVTQVPAPSLKRPSTTPTPDGGSVPHVSVIGSGWTAILAVQGQPPRRYGSYSQPGQSDGAQGSTLGAIIQQLPTVSGSWGTGRLLSTRLLSVLITNDGRVFAGAVAPSALYAAAASHK